MASNPSDLLKIPLFSLLHEDEASVLAARVEKRYFQPQQRIYSRGEPGVHTYIITFMATLIVYTAINVVLKQQAWDPILLFC